MPDAAFAVAQPQDVFHDSPTTSGLQRSKGVHPINYMSHKAAYLPLDHFEQNLHNVWQCGYCQASNDAGLFRLGATSQLRE